MSKQIIYIIGDGNKIINSVEIELLQKDYEFVYLRRKDMELSYIPSKYKIINQFSQLKNNNTN